FEYDARVRKEAESLTRAGYAVTVIAIHVPGVTAERETLPSAVEVLRIPRPYGALGRLTRASTVTPGVSVAPLPSRAGSNSQRPAPRWQCLGKSLVRRVLRLAAPVARAANTWWLDRRMRRAAVTRNPDVVHAHDLNTLKAGAQAAA